jgi:hypothetical protein
MDFYPYLIDPQAIRTEDHCNRVVSFFAGDELKHLGGRFEEVANWQSLAITDGRRIRGQNQRL